MKVLEINTEKSWRGGERQTIYNAEGLISIGITVELLCLKNFPLAAKATTAKIPVHLVAGMLSALFYLIRNAKQFDVLHAQTAKTQFYAVLTKPFHHRKVVYTRRVDFVPNGWLTKMKYAFTEKTIAISDAIKNILETFGVKNVEVISDAVAEKKLNTERAKKLIADNNWNGKKIIATTTAFVPHKDPLTMVNAIAALSQMRNDFVFLHFGDGILKTAIEEKIIDLQLTDYYKLMGFADEVEDFFSVYDVFVMSSEEEGLGSSVLDSFIYKVPVATTDAGGLKELVAENGLTCPVKDHQSLAANIYRLLEDKQLCNQLTEKAYGYVLEKHSVKKIAMDYIALFNKLCKH